MNSFLEIFYRENIKQSITFQWIISEFKTINARLAVCLKRVCKQKNSKIMSHIIDISVFARS